MEGLSVRCPEIDGSINFRDLGGYETSSGEKLRWNRIFRSGHFTDVTETGWKQLAEMRFRVVLDLRQQFEQDNLPTCWQGELPPKILAAGQIESGTFNNAGMLAWDGDLNLEQARQRRIASYRHKPIEYAESMRLLFEQLARPESYPLVFHCVAGKDRTGFAAAVILDWLGVPREKILEDYLLSGKSAGKITPDRIRRIIEMYGLQRSGLDSLKAITEVRAEYLDAALNALEAYKGSEGYLLGPVGLSVSTLHQVQEQLLGTT